MYLIDYQIDISFLREKVFTPLRNLKALIINVLKILNKYNVVSLKILC